MGTQDSFQTPEEDRILADIQRQEDGGEDPFGDFDDDGDSEQGADEQETEASKPEMPSADDQDVADQDVAVDGEGAHADDAGDADDEDGADAGDAEAQDHGAADPDDQDEGHDDDPLSLRAGEPPASAAPSYKAEVPPDYDAKMAEIAARRAEAFTMFADGDIDAAEFAKVDAETQAESFRLLSERTRAETLIEATAQAKAYEEQAIVNRFIARTKDEVDYANNPDAVAQFDAALSAVSAAGRFKGAPYATRLDEAHRIVAASMGVAPAAAPLAKQKQPPPNRQPTAPVPPTLRNAPQASNANSGGSTAERMGALHGQDFEDAFAKLSPAQQAALLDD